MKDIYKNSYNMYLYKHYRRQELIEALKGIASIIGGAVLFIVGVYAFAMLAYVLG